jgi:hypothetical protein
MRLSQRLIAATVLVALSTILGACSSSMSNFDPSDLLDWMDSKKKLPGQRQPVFPDGVPGLEQGVPKDLYRGAQEQPADPNAQTATAAPPPPVEEPKGKKAKGKKLKQPAAAPDGAQPAAEADPNAPADANAPTESEGAAPAVPPAPKPKKIVRRRITAPPPDQQAAQPAQQAAPAQQQQSAAPFPAPLPSSTFQR